MENTFVLKLDDGADIFAELEEFAKKKNIEYGLIVSGFGKIKEFELISSGSQASIERTSYAGKFEVNAISGKLQKTRDGRINKEIRVLLSSTGFTGKSGLLAKGKACESLEIGIRKIDLKRIIEA